MYEPSPTFTGVLLIGGAGTRIGRDKALIDFGGKPLWEYNRRALAEVCPTLLLAGNRPDLATGEITVHTDTFPGSSLAGLHTGLTHAKTDWITSLPCDLPFPSPELLRRLQETVSDDVDAVIPRTRLGREPLIGCYHKRALEKIARRLETDRPKILDLLNELEVRYLEEAELPAGWRRSLHNINTPADLEKLQQPPPALAFIANSGTGKTTLIVRLIEHLAAAGWTVGALKHDAHNFEIDHEGKDSWRLARAGAAVTAISSHEQTAVIRRHELPPELDELLLPFTGKVDLVLTEGFRQSTLPKIAVYRQAAGHPPLSRGMQNDQNLIAVASDIELDLDVPVFDLNEPSGLVRMIEKKLLIHA